MSLARDEPFEFDSAPIGPVESGTSILLTGDDEKAVRSVFFQLMAPAESEQAVVIATDDSGKKVERAFDRTNRRSSARVSTLTAQGTANGDDTQLIEDMSDLTRLGMDFTALLASAQQRSSRFRSGIYLCSTICGEAEDLRSVYRLLNSSFLSELRRGEGIGVCAIDTSADVGANLRSVIAGMNSSFKGRIDVEKTGAREAELTISGLSNDTETVTVGI